MIRLNLYCLVFTSFVTRAVNVFSGGSGGCDASPCGVGVCKEVADTDRYRCVCPAGYLETDINGITTCRDVDECSFPDNINPCGGTKGTKCVNVPGSFTCTCAKNFYWDGYACQRKGKKKQCPSMEPPKFLLAPEHEVTITLGDELKLTCVGTGMPAPNVYWTKGPDRARLGPVATGQSIFFLPNVTKKDIDVYECVLEDCCSGHTVRSRVDVSVLSEPCKDPKLQLFGMVWEYKSWFDAKQFCESRNLTMGVIRSEKDRDIMRKDAWRAYQYDPNGKKFSNEFWLWIGVHDKEEEGNFKTVDGESVEGIAKWLPQEPDNWLKLDPRGQDVVAIHRFSAYWDDSYEFHLRPFACQCPVKEE